MACSPSEALQFQIEVQEGIEGADGEVIIIYNCDGAELTPELVAKTLEELSTQTSLYKNASNQGQIVSQPAAFDCLTDQNVDFSSHLDTGLLPVSVIKAEGQDESESVIHVPAPSDLSGIAEHGKELYDVKPELKEVVKENAGERFVENVSLEEVKEDELLKDITVTNDESKNDPVNSPDTSPLNSAATKNTSLPAVKSELSAVYASDEEEKIQDYLCEKCEFVSSVEIELQRHKKFEHKEEEPFVCRHCGKAFRVELSLEVHKIAHSKQAKSPFSKFDPGFIHKVMKFFSCPLCDFQYQKKSQLSSHIKSMHAGESYLTCPQCPYSCLTQEVLDNHVSSPAHVEEKRTLCPLCGTATKDIRQHLKRTHNDDRPFLCSQCGFKAKTATNLSTHMIIHDPVKRVTCALCQYKCRTKDQLKRHLVKHSSDKSHQCSLCDFACKTGMSLKRHMQIHQTPNKYVCSVCEFTTHDKILLRQHKAKEHVLKALHKCQECNIKFDRAVELKKHAMAVHKSDRINFCSYCDFSGETVTDLRIHMQSHFGKFPYTCSQCGYMCRLKASYRRHMERHNKVKKYACTLCSYACVEKYDLQKHYTHRHSDEKPLACPYCSYRCKFKPRLNNHIAYVHSDIKPFFCKQCPYTGKSAENLKKHMVNHGVVIKSIQCVLCNYATAERAKLKRHMQVHVKKAIFQ